MVNLIRKDILATRVFWALGVAVFLLFEFMFIESGPLFILFGVAMTFLALLGLLLLEDRYRVEAFFAGLPVSRKTIVKAKYGSAGLIAAAGLLLYLAAGLAFGALAGAWGFKANVEVSLPSAVLFLTGFILLTAFYLPFYFRLGLGRSLAPFLFCSLILAVYLSWLRSLFRGRDSLLAKALDLNPLEAARTLLEKAGTIPTLVLLGLILGALIFASARLSAGFYCSRDL